MGPAQGRKYKAQLNGVGSMRYSNGSSIGMAILAGVGIAGAHLTANSLKLSGTGPYHPGETVTVTWGVAQAHDGINVDFSSDGKTWTSLKGNLSKSEATYRWTVPQTLTQQGRIRICQMQGTTTCTDANNASRPSSGAPYVLVSTSFTITASTALMPRESETPISLIVQGPGLMKLAFSLVTEDDVAFQVFDLEGRLQATLLAGHYAPGTHAFTITVPQSITSARALVLRSKLGESVSNRPWTPD